MAAGAITGGLQAGTSVWDASRDFAGMAADAEGASVTSLPEMGTRRSMWLMAAQASVDSFCVVLERERSALVLVTLDAECLGVGTKLMLLRASMRIVAVSAIDYAFLDAVVCRHRELRSNARMARGAEVFLRGAHHCALSVRSPLVLNLVTRVNVVAIQAGDASEHVLTLAHVTLFACLLVAAQAHVRDR